ncbi:MAG: transporter [Bermanella sp.]
MSQLNHSLKIACALLATSPAFAHDWNSDRPDSHAPISVMGDHTHNEGEFMVSYRNMQMDMNGLQDGTQSVSSQEVIDSGYMMAPTKMSMNMHMFGLMYAPTNQTTMMVMLPYIEKDMDMLMSSGMTTSMNSEGLGDIKVGALHNIFSEAGQKIHLNLMMSLPTGSIDEEDDVGAVMPYAMQLGSGTFDLLPGITYTAQAENFSYGAQAQATIRLGENDRDYTLGDRYKLQSWVQMPVHQRVSLSLRLAYEDWDTISGEDDELNAMMTPTADTDLQGGNLLSAGLGVNVALPQGHRVAIEYSKELEQDLDGPQMAQDDTLTLAWQLAF